MLPGCWTLPIDCSRSHPLHGSSLPFPRWRRRRNSSSRLPPPGSLAVAARPLPGAAPSHPGRAHPACCWAQRGPHDAGPRDDPAPPEPCARDVPRRRIPAPATTPMLNLALRSTWPMLTRAQVPVSLPKAPCIPVCRRSAPAHPGLQACPCLRAWPWYKRSRRCKSRTYALGGGPKGTDGNTEA